MPIRLLTLGGLRSSAENGDLDWLASQWLRAAILVHLAVERTATRDGLLAMFWPENDGETASHRLSQTVYTLRRTLGEGAIETRGRELRAGHELLVDALDFERACADARYEEAIALYQGPFLAGVHLAPTHAFESWVDSRRAHFGRQFRKACRALIETQLQAGELSGAVAAAHAWVAPDPLDDEAQHRLIELLAKSGARNEALKQYETYARVLAAEGLEPLDQTRELVSVIERQTDATVAPMAVIPATAPHTAPDLPPPPGATQTMPTPRLEAEGPRRIASNRAAIGRATLAAVALGAIALAWRIADRPEPATAEAILATPLPVAVLVFRDQQESRSALPIAITASLIEALNAFPLHTRPLTAVWRYRDTNLSHDSIARVLAVNLIIDGVVHSDDDEVRVWAELTDASTGRRVPIRVSGRAGNDLALTEDLAREIARRLDQELRPQLGRAIDLQRWQLETSSDEAFRNVHEATRLSFERDTAVSAGNWRRALDMLREADVLLAAATRADPDWAEPAIQRAWVARNIAYTEYGNHFASDSIRVAIRSGLGALEPLFVRPEPPPRAYEARGALHFASLMLTDPDSVQKVTLRSQIHDDLARAARANGARARSLLSAMHFQEGRLSEAAEHAELAFNADAWLEDAREILNRLFTIRFEQGNDSEAERWCGEISHRFEGTWDHAACRLRLMAWSTPAPDADEAWRLARRAIEATAPAYRIGLGQEVELRLAVASVLARIDPDSARRVMDDALELAREQGQVIGEFGPRIALERADVHMRLGQSDSAAMLIAAIDTAASPWIREGRRFGTLRR